MKKLLSRLKLRSRFLVASVPVTVVIYIVFLVFTTYSSRSNERENARQIAMLKAQESANNAGLPINRAFTAARSLAQAFEGLKDTGLLSRELATRMLYELTAKNREFLSVWSTWETDAFDGNDAGNINGTGSNEKGRYTCGWYWKGDVIGFQVPSEEETLSSDYYLLPKKRQSETIIEPYLYTYNPNEAEILMTSVVVPIMTDGVFAGSVGIDIGLDYLQEVNQKVKIYETGHGVLLSNEGAVVAERDSSALGKVSPLFEKESFTKTLVKGKVFYSLEHNDFNSDTLRLFVPTYFGNSDQAWYSGIEVPVAEVMANANRDLLVTLAMGLAGIALLFALIWFLSATLTRPILEGIQFTKKVTGGDLTAQIVITDQHEVGDMISSMKHMVENLRDTMLNIKQIANSLAASSSDLSASAQQLSMGASEQASAAEQVSASMEQMSASIEQNAENAQETEIIAKKARESIQLISQAVHNMTQAINEIVSHISIINEIAQKTDMLAINAAIEAARAGAYGKGFAVVAGEIRELANRSQRAALSIGQKSAANMALAQDSLRMISELMPNVENTARLVMEISAASREQNTGIAQINEAINQLSQVVQQNSAASEEIAARSEELNQEADNLLKAILFFKTEAGGTQGFVLPEEIKKQLDLLQQLLANSEQPVEAVINLRSETGKNTATRLNPPPADKMDSEYEDF